MRPIPGGSLDRFTAAVAVIAARPVTRQEIVEATGSKYETVSAWVQLLVDRKLVREDGEVKPPHGGDPAKRFAWAGGA